VNLFLREPKKARAKITAHPSYEERGAVIKARANRRAAKMIRELLSLGYRLDLARQRPGMHDEARDFRPCLALHFAQADRREAGTPPSLFSPEIQ
jgi:hypothetical protein